MAQVKPFSYAHITIISGEQRSGKNTTCYARVRDAYDKDCVKIYLETVKGIKDFKVLAYNRFKRVARVKYKGKIYQVRIPESYKMRSPMKVFSVFHLYGLPYVYCTWAQIVEWLNNDVLKDAWLLLDQYEIVGNAREGMGPFAKYLEKKSFQFGKRHLEVYILVPMERVADWTMRNIATERIICSYDEHTRMITLKIKKRRIPGIQTITYYAPYYWGGFDPDEEIKLPDTQVLRAMAAAS